MDDIEFAIWRSVREYPLKSDHMPNRELTLLWQAKEVNTISNKLYHNNPAIPSDTATYLKVKK